jgi:hypothetical protein
MRAGRDAEAVGGRAYNAGCDPDGSFPVGRKFSFASR